MKHSESIANLAKALSAFQGEIKNPANTAVNPFFKSKYAPLADVINSIRPALSKHGLSILQSSESEGDTVSVTTLLMHASGEWIESDRLALKPDKLTPQGAGAVITYARRYSLSALLNISSEDDDDANSAEHRSHTEPVKHEQTKPQASGKNCPVCHAPAGKPHASGCTGGTTKPEPTQTSPDVKAIETAINLVIDKNTDAANLPADQRKALFHKTLKRITGRSFISDFEKATAAELSGALDKINAELN
jgi:hypothetical protein